MSASPTRRRPWLIGVATAIAAGVIGTIVAVWPNPMPAPSPPASAIDPVAAQASAERRDRAASPVIDARRSPVATAAAPTSNEVRFGQLLEQLVQLAVRLGDAVRDEDRDDAEQVQVEADAVWALLRRCVPPPEESGLFELGVRAGEGPTPTDDLRRRLCLRVIDEGLGWRLRRFEANGDRRPLDQLVDGILAGISGDEALAEPLAALLLDQPYLSLAHEDQVLDLVAAAAEHEFLVELASGMLRTLWQNLERSGARSSAELAGLALLFIEDANPSRRLAALTHLLNARGGQFRDVVVANIVRGHDAQLAREVGMAAAVELAPEAALDVLESLSPVGGQRMMAAFMALGERDTIALRRAYDERLARNSDPQMRAELVTGAGFRGTADGVEMARSAFDLDPSAEVRSRAMFVLTAQAGSALGESTLMAALDDVSFSGDPMRLGQIALALENLVGTGEVNAIDRVGHRLLARTELSPPDRKRVEALLKRVLPPR